MSRKGRTRTAKRRYPNGDAAQITEAQRRKDTLSVAKAARERVYGLPSGQTERIEAGSVLGRLALSGQISETQRLAGEEYERVVSRYRHAILVKPVASAGNLDRSGGYDDSDGTNDRYVEACNAARRGYDGARRALLSADPLAILVLDAVVLEGKDMPLHVGELRAALNALAHLFRVEEWRASGTSRSGG